MGELLLLNRVFNGGEGGRRRRAMRMYDRFYCLKTGFKEILKSNGFCPPMSINTGRKGMDSQRSYQFVLWGTLHYPHFAPRLVLAFVAGLQASEDFRLVHDTTGNQGKTLAERARSEGNMASILVGIGPVKQHRSPRASVVTENPI